MSTTTIQRSIEILVSPSGETRLQTKGFTGSACRQASGFLEAALGDRAGEQLTAEFFHPPTVQTEQLKQGS